MEVYLVYKNTSDDMGYPIPILIKIFSTKEKVVKFVEHKLNGKENIMYTGGGEKTQYPLYSIEKYIVE